MLSKVSTLSSALALTTVITSATMAIAGDRSHFSGLYGGLSAGYITGDSSLKSNFLAPPNKASKDVSARGINGELALGYGYLSRTATPLYLGVEVMGSLANLSGKAENIQNVGGAANLTTAKTRLRNSYGAAARLGTVFSNALAYLKVGAANAKWEIKSTNQAAGETDRKTLSKRATGLVLGFGVEAPVTQKIGVGAEFVHTQYKAMKVTHPGIVAYTMKPRTNEAKLRLTYHIM